MFPGLKPQVLILLFICSLITVVYLDVIIIRISEQFLNFNRYQAN